jgi:hypothetical protein
MARNRPYPTAEYAGGPNAGHTLVVGDEKLVVRLLPSGILRQGTLCVLGQGMVVDPEVLVGEIDELVRRGHSKIEERLLLSERAHLILPYHITIDGLRESSAPQDRAIGTPKKGIGPAYEDKVRRTGIRAGELRNLDRLAERVGAALEAWAPTHPTPSVLGRLLSTRLYPGPRDIFATNTMPVTELYIGPPLDRLASKQGHVVVRVEPGGDQYQVFILEDSRECTR